MNCSRRLHVAMLLMGWSMGGCATAPDISVRQDTSPQVDPGSISSFRWHSTVIEPTAHLRQTREELDQRIRDAIGAELERNGVRQVDVSPDVLVGYSAAMDKELDVSTVNLQYGYAPGFGAPMVTGPGYRRYTPGWAPKTKSVRSFEQGTLVLDIIDAKTKDLLWRSSAQAEVHRDAPEAERERRLQEAVRRMLQGFNE